MMNAKPMKVGEIAMQFNVTPNTVRNWCRRYAAYLSAGANPTGGGERIFSPRDIAVFAYVHTAMQDGVNHGEIALQLAEKTFNSDGEDLFVGLTEVVSTTPAQAPPTAQESPSDAGMLPIVLSSMASRQDATDKRIDSLERALLALDQRQVARADSMVTGIVIGGAVVLVVVALVLALGQ